MGLQKERKGQESHMEIYPPEKGISPFVKASSLQPEDLKLGSSPDSAALRNEGSSL